MNGREEGELTTHDCEQLRAAAAHVRRRQRCGLTAWGVDVDDFTTHLYRRTTATFVERPAGITRASRLLGPASEQITRASYVVCAVEVDPITIDILDEVLGS